MTIKAWVLAFSGAIFSVLFLQMIVMYFVVETPGAVVLFPPAGLISTLPEDVAIVGAGSHWIALRSDIDRLGRELYHSGALIVLPAGLPGCLPLPGTF
jgi:hypothetical protein